MSKGTNLEEMIERVQGVALRALFRGAQKYFIDSMLAAAVREVIELQKNGKVDGRL